MVLHVLCLRRGPEIVVRGRPALPANIDTNIGNVDGKRSIGRGRYTHRSVGETGGGGMPAGSRSIATVRYSLERSTYT